MDWTIYALPHEAAHLELDLMSDKLWALQWEAYDAHNKLRAAEVELNQCADTYAVRSGQRLCNMMYDIVPHELRKLVYDHMIDGIKVMVHNKTWVEDDCDTTSSYRHPDPTSGIDGLIPSTSGNFSLSARVCTRS
jgi:hypothetical protein